MTTRTAVLSALLSLLGTGVGVGSAPAPASPNLLTNPGFEAGTGGWFALGPIVLTATASEAHSGSFSGLAAARTGTWNGPAQDLLGVVESGKAYRISGWVRLANAASDTVQLTVKHVEGPADYLYVDSGTATDDGWLELSGVLTLEFGAGASELFLYFEGPAPGVDFYVDDAAVEELGDWVADANARIEAIRKRDADLLVVDPLGHPLAGVGVQVQQTRHDFAFGSALSDQANFNTAYQEFFRTHFEWATFENQTKWPANEPQQDQEDYADADAMLAFCQANGIRVHGHTVFWAVDQFQPGWLGGISHAQLAIEVEDRLHSVVGRYQGAFEHWDVNNEMMHGSYFQDRLGPGIRPWMFQEARAVDPGALLFVNDYNVITSSETQSYIQHIQDLQAQGAPIDAIGVQGHFGDVVSAHSILGKLDQLQALGLPVWVTEYDAVDRDPAARADKLETAYRAAFSHPAVDGIIMWGFWAGAHWRGRDAAIVDRNWSLNEAGVRYEALLAEWTTITGGATDAAGTLGFRGFHGDYDVTLDDAGGPAALFTRSLPEGPGPMAWVLPRQPGACLAAGEVGTLELRHDGPGSGATLTWDPPVEHPGMALLYDVLRSTDAADFRGAGACVEVDDGGDRRWQDAGAPAHGAVHFFLVRGRNVCPSAEGPLGPGPAGAARVGPDC